MTSREDFLAKRRIAAAENGGRPLGEQRFYRRFGFSRNDLWAAGFHSYGAACNAADLQANTLTARISDDELFRPLAVLTRQHGRYPSKGFIEVARKQDPSFPSWEAYKRRERQGPESTLEDIFLAWCRASPDHADISNVLVGTGAGASQQRDRRTSRPVVRGYVYLMRYGTAGSVFKIGISQDVARRHAQIRMVTPQDTRIVHSIPTDDPEGIETYWHGRFAPKRLDGKKELFRLEPDDVAAFRSRKYQ